MATAILTPTTGSAYQILNTAGSDPLLPDGIGSSDLAVCMQSHGSGNYVHCDTATNMGEAVGFYMNAGVSIPVGATITNVAISVWHKSDAPDPATGGNPAVYSQVGTIDLNGNLGFSWYDEQVASGFTIFHPGASYENWNIATYTAGNLNPWTGLAWTRADLISMSFGWDSSSIFTGVQPVTYDVDYFALIVTYTGGVPSTWYYNPVTNNYQYATSPPGSPWQPLDPFIAAESINPAFGSTSGGD